MSDPSPRPECTRRRPLALAVIAALLASGCETFDEEASEAPVSPDVIELGILVPVTGASGTGAALRTGAQLAVEQINAAGGVLGKELRGVVADTEGIPDVAELSAGFLADRGVVAMVGASASSSTLRAAETTAIPRGIPMISPSSTSPLIAELDDDGLIFRTVLSDAFQGQVAASLAIDSGAATAGVLYVRNAYGDGLAASFRDEFERLEGEVVAFVPYPELSAGEIEQHSYESALEEVVAPRPDLVYLVTYALDGAKITIEVQNVLAEGHDPIFLGCDANAELGFVESGDPRITEGMIGTAPSPPVDDPRFQAFADAYRDRFGTEAQVFADSAYDATFLIAYAMERGGSADPRSIADHLTDVSAGGTEVGVARWAEGRALLADGVDIDYQGAAGSVDFDERGELTSGTYRVWRIEDGAIVPIDLIAFAAD